MGWNKENTIRTKDKINPQHYRTRVFFCVIKLYGSIWGWICIDSPYIALLLLFICFFFKILPCYFPEQPVNTVEIRFIFSQQYKPVYDNLEADETKRLTTQIVNAVSLTFVSYFTS